MILYNYTLRTIQCLATHIKRARGLTLFLVVWNTVFGTYLLFVPPWLTAFHLYPSGGGPRDGNFIYIICFCLLVPFLFFPPILWLVCDWWLPPFPPSIPAWLLSPRFQSWAFRSFWFCSCSVSLLHFITICLFLILPREPEDNGKYWYLSLASVLLDSFIKGD